MNSISLAQTRRHFPTLDSTNTYALNWQDAPHGALVLADTQTAGRGRLGRTWNSPPGSGLYFSLVLRDLSPCLKSRLSLVIGLAVAEAVEREAGVSTQLKWPNDILVRGHKIGGILCESTPDRVVAGVGLNLNFSQSDLPERPVFPASSLLLLAGRAFDRDTILEAIVVALQAQLNSTQGVAQLRAIEKRLFGLNELARAGGVLGLIEGLGDDGALRLRGADGLVEVRSGEVEFF